MNAPVRIALKTLAVVATITAIALAIAQDQETLKIHSDIPAHDPKFAGYAAAILGAATTSGDRVDVLRNGDEIFPAMLQAIRGAKRRITFETYIYSFGTVASEFTDAFVQAAARGVTVNIVVDAVGGSDVDTKNVEALERAGVKLAWFNRVHWYTLEELNYRTHRKILVVDGQVAFTGGAGLADQWLGHAESKEHWRDTQFRIEGPAARLLEGAFYENWAETGGEVTPILDDEPQVKGQTQTIVAWSSPSGGTNIMKRLYVLALAGASRTIDLQSPYFITDESTRWSLLEARKRGVRIRVLVEGDRTDAAAVKYASRYAYEEFLAAGFEIYEYQPTMMHAKAMVVDGTVSVFGSANFDNRSLELNDELNLAVSDPDLGRRISADFEDDLKQSKRLNLEEWRQRSRMEQFREKLWSFFGEVF